MQKSSRIIPLFEEYETLSNIDELLSDFFENDELLQMMKGDKDYVTVFVGMSDGQKTTGPFFPYLASDAEERSLGVSEKFGVKILVYQGIGSSQSRGQDRHPEREYGAKPSIRYSPQIERTIQGEAIHRLRPQDLAKHAAAIITNHVLRDEEAQSLSLEHNREIDSQKRNAVLQMNKVAREAFSNLTLSEEFSYFLAHFSPPLDSLNPASRPNNRSTNPDAYPYQCNFPDLRAVPANYQDIQAQTLLSTFYGAGEAFRQANDTTNTPGNLPITDLLYRKNSYFYDARFHKNVQFMIEAIASSGIDVTEAMLDMRLQAVKDPNIAGYLKSTLTKIKEAQDLAVTELEQFVETDGTASGSSSARDRAASMLDNPLLKEDISRRLPYITVLSFISVHGLNTFDLYAAKDNETSTFGFDLARIAACGKANGYRQVG